MDDVPEERRHLHEVRVLDVEAEPNYAGMSEGIAEGHGSPGNQAESSPPQDGGDSASGRQPTQASTSDLAGLGEQVVPAERSASVERRTEDVSQVQRSLNFMTGLLTTLTDRMVRVEQWQSAAGSTAGGAMFSTGGSSAMTPVTPHVSGLGRTDMDRLNQQLSQLHVGNAGEERPTDSRPLATMDKMMRGTFSSDSSETAARRAQEVPRAVPGVLLNDPMDVDAAGPQGGGSAGSLDAAEVKQTVESVMRSQAQHGDRGDPGTHLAGMKMTSSMSSTQRMTEPPGMSSPQRMNELSSMPSPQRMTEPPGISSPQRMNESSSISWPQRISEPPGMSPSLSMPPPQRSMELSGMTWSSAANPQSMSQCLRAWSHGIRGRCRAFQGTQDRRLPCRGRAQRCVESQAGALRYQWASKELEVRLRPGLDMGLREGMMLWRAASLGDMWDRVDWVCLRGPLCL